MFETFDDSQIGPLSAVPTVVSPLLRVSGSSEGNGSEASYMIFSAVFTLHGWNIHKSSWMDGNTTHITVIPVGKASSRADASDRIAELAAQSIQDGWEIDTSRAPLPPRRQHGLGNLPRTAAELI